MCVLAYKKKPCSFWGLEDGDFQMLLQEFRLNTVEDRVIAGDAQISWWH